MNSTEASVDTLIEQIDPYRESQDLIIYHSKINEYSIQYTLYGKAVMDFIYNALEVRSNDPYTYSNIVNQMLFERIFGNKYHLEFNEHIRIEKAIIIDDITRLQNEGFDFGKIMERYIKEQKPFYHFEIDAQITMRTLEEPKFRFENKMFTCPNQRADVLEKYCLDSFLKNLFVVRDFLGLITFANVVDSNDINRSFEFPDEIEPRYRYGWFLHFVVIDKRILKDNRVAARKAEEILNALRSSHDFFMRKVGLNGYPLYGGSTKKENFFPFLLIALKKNCSKNTP